MGAMDAGGKPGVGAVDMGCMMTPGGKCGIVGAASLT